MSNPEDPARTDRPASQGTTPSWVDEVLGTSRSAPAPAATPTPAPSSAPTPVSPAATAPSAPAAPPAPQGSAASGWPEDLRIPDPAPRAAPSAPAPAAAPTAYADDDWVSRATGAQAKNPSLPTGPAVTPTPAASQSVRSELDSLGDSARHALQQVQTSLGSGDVSQKKLIAGLLGIVLGSLGVHKFYLGMTTPGLIMLGVNVGVWVLALLLGLVTLGVGLIVTIPLASLVSGAIGLLGLVEGILYLTKSDADFQRDYVLGKKAWL